jgi:hypothetical protein
MGLNILTNLEMFCKMNFVTYFLQYFNFFTIFNFKKKNSMKNSKRLLKHVGQVALGIISATLVVSSAGASDVANEALGSEGGKAAINQALKVARSKPALSVAAAIVCTACLPVAGVAASPALCVACGILFTKVIG